MLHVTNGDCAVHVLRKAGLQGDLLPWRDVLHDGPVREGLSLEALSEERAAFIAGCGWAPLEVVRSDFRARDARLAKSSGDDEVVLWFEHDLYDQLQLLQLLDWFAAHPHPRLSLVCEPEYLGLMAPERAAALFRLRTPITEEQLQQAAAAWKAFRAPEPSMGAYPALRFVDAAFVRLYEELPWTVDGHSRIEREVLDVLEDGPLPFADLFERHQRLEDPIFLGDASLLLHLSRMEAEGLVEQQGGTWRFVSRTRVRRVERWLGGIRVDERSPWRWDPGKRGVVRG